MTPMLDPRSREDIMRKLAAHAREYTPEWRYEGAEDDPGSALAELFGEMFYQTVDRINSVPEKLHTEFLNLTGFQMPDPAPASGLMRFTAHETVEKPVPVPEGTQVFTMDEDGENVVYSTLRAIESTPARLVEIFYADPRAEIIERRELAGPEPFFAPAGAENLQCHRFTLSRNEVLTLKGPFEVEVELRQRVRFAAVESAKRLADPSYGRWSFLADGKRTGFTSVKALDERVILTYEGNGTFEPDENGVLSVAYESHGQVEKLTLDGARLKSRPLGRTAIDSAACGDVLLELGEGDYCFGRRPAVYSLCYLRSDQAFSKRGARVELALDVAPVTTDPPNTGPQYQYNRRIIDKRDAAVITPDDVFVSQVTWEYNTSMGWRPLKLEGDKNPFSGKKSGRLAVTFEVPEDMEATEVNSQYGYFIRARVVHVENEFSMAPRWIVPFLKGADCAWEYPEGLPVDRCEAENNGETAVLEDVSGVSELNFTALEGLADHPAAMYFRFDRSPNAMPLSIYFDVAGRVKLTDKLNFEAWNGSRFEPVNCVDLTRNLLHPGTMLLRLPGPLAEGTMFGVTGYWLRLSRSSYLAPAYGVPQISGMDLNVVDADARQAGMEEVFSAGVYEANLRLELFRTPVLDTAVWVDETAGLSVQQAQRLEEELPGQVRVERDNRVLAHCWVLWKRTPSLALCGGDERCYELDPYEGTVSFGDGIHGKVVPEGLDNIVVRYACGGGSRGNRPAGSVHAPVGALPRISEVVNITSMSGGTDRLSPERADAVAGKRLRNRDRAAGARDFEEIVALKFPEARHVKCFTARDEKAEYAPGHVCVVVEGGDLDGKRAADDLCQRVFEELSARCDCVMTAENRLHVVGSTAITVSSTVIAEVEDINRAVAAQYEITRRLEELINVSWRERDIGSQIRIDEVWQTVRDTPNVRSVRNILLEGRYGQNGVERVVPLTSDGEFPYGTVRSGVHLVQVI